MKKSFKILIVGGNGFVGSTLARALRHEHQVIATYQNNFTPIPQVEFYQAKYLDSEDQGKSLIAKTAPEVVIVCTGSNDPQEAEQDKNAMATLVAHSAISSNLVPSVDVLKGKFIYISSSYVFSGLDGNFSEDATAIPNYQLGKAKASAENFVSNRSLNHVIIRCAPLLGRGTIDHPSWLDRLRDANLHGEKTLMHKNSIHNPVHISMLVEVVKKSLSPEIRNQVFHVGGLNKLPLFTFGQIICGELNLKTELLEAPDAESQASPSDFSLNFSKTLSTLQIEPLFLEQSIERLL